MTGNNPFDNSGESIPAPKPAPAPPAPGPAPIVVPTLGIEVIAEFRGYNAGIELIDNAFMGDVTAALDDALRRKAGHPMFNPRGLRVRDFDMQYFIERYYGGSTGPQCLFVHKRSGEAIASAVMTWPRNDFWAILVELSRLG